MNSYLKIVSVLFLVLAMLMVTTTLIITFVSYVNQRIFMENITGIVSQKYQDGEVYFVVVDDEIFSNKDEVWWGKFNSITLQKKIEEGGFYRFVVTGWKGLPVYRNIAVVDFTP